MRKLGVALGLPHDMVYRHPFPGPGLGVRILGEVKKEFADLLREADAIFIEELRNTPFELPPVARDRRGQGAGELVRGDQPGVCRVPAGEIGGRDGRWPHL